MGRKVPYLAAIDAAARFHGAHAVNAAIRKERFMRIIDLSVALKAGIVSDPPSMLPKIEYLDHKQGAQDFAMMFPGLKPEQLPNGEGAAMERITFTTHN